MKTKIYRVFVCIFGCTAILSGCIYNFVTPISLTNGSWTTANPRLALQPNGTKHIVWQEQGLNGSGQIAQIIIYERTKIGEDDLHYAFIPPTGYDYLAPDVAVTDSGYAYVVWQKKSQSDPSIRYGCYDIVPPEGSVARLCQELTIDPVSQIIDTPIVVARGAIVYALYNTEATTGIRIRYRQLRILDDSYGWASSLSTFMDKSYQAAIDSMGKLHITWTRFGGPFPSIYYNSNASVDIDNNMNRLRLLDDNASGSKIAIAGSSPEEAFVMYEVCIPCRIYLHHCSISSCSNPMTETDLPYDPDPDSWNTYGGDIGISSNILFITFAATNSETGFGNNEIYLYSFPSSSLDRLTNNSISDRVPNVEDGGGSPVVSYLSGAEPDISLLIWDQMSGARKIKEIENYSLFFYDHKMVGKNGWVAGIWLDDFNGDDDTPTPWLAFNAYLVNLPMIVK